MKRILPKMLESKWLKTFMLGTAALALLTTPAFALDFQYSFINSAGNVGLPTDVITGRILGLDDNSFNFQETTVTLDSVFPSIDPAFTAPYSWKNFGVFEVSGGVLTHISWSAIDGSYAINIDTDNAAFIATASFGNYYLAGEGLTITPLASVPEGGSTMLLLGAGIAGLGVVRRKLAK